MHVSAAWFWAYQCLIGLDDEHEAPIVHGWETLQVNEPGIDLVFHTSCKSKDVENTTKQDEGVKCHLVGQFGDVENTWCDAWWFII